MTGALRNQRPLRSPLQRERLSVRSRRRDRRFRTGRPHARTHARPRSSGAARVAAKTMRLLAGLGGALLLPVVLWGAFETIILPPRVNRRLRLTRAFSGATWAPRAASARLVPAGNRPALVPRF